MIVIFSALVAAVVAFYLIWLRPDAPDQTADRVIEEPTALPEQSPTPSLSDRLSDRLALVTLRTSDVAVRELVGELSEHPKLAAWLVNEDLIRRFVATVDSIADGVSPVSQLEFMRPKEKFRVIGTGETVIADPKSYGRYDLATEVFDSLDTEGAIALFRELEPLIDEAYREISPPGEQFSDRLDAAIDHLLEVTPPTDEPKLRRKVVTYLYVDESLESLSGAQRQLLRMGSDNVAIIRAKLRDLKAGLQ
jgi:hypothetical protein